MRPSLVEVVGRTLVTGAMNGLFLLGFLVMVNLGLPENDCTLVVFPGAVCAAMLGGLISVAFLPSLLVLTAAHRRILSVRPGSLAATVFVRRVWLLTSGIVAAHVAAVMGATRRLSAWHAPAGWADMLAAAGMAAAVVAMALVAAEVADFGRLRAAARAVAGLTSLETLSPPPTLGPVAADFLDLGVGTSRFVSLGSGRDPYRAVDLAIPRIDGDPAGVRRTLLRSAREDALALLLLLAPVLLALAWWRIA